MTKASKDTGKQEGVKDSFSMQHIGSLPLLYG
jgi:hypothetical protein